MPEDDFHGLPDPHPLDFDWRFSTESAQDIMSLLPRGKSILCIGAPAIARLLERSGRKVTLIDRQPIQGVHNHIRKKIGSFSSPRKIHGAAVIDPPWYPIDFIKWLRWTASFLEIGSQLYIPMWPASTRPFADSETRDVISDLAPILSFEDLNTVVEYQVPRFEQIATSFADGGMSKSPRMANLYRATVVANVDSHSWVEPVRWSRFIINNYQLAVRLEPGTDSRTIPVKGSYGRYWPYVSLRAPNREDIGIWSSDNEVSGRVEDQLLSEAVRAALVTETSADFTSALTGFPDLLEWSIPRPPYQRIMEWDH